MKINKKKVVQVDAKTLSLCIKVCDQFDGVLKDQDGADIAAYSGYVPEFMPGEHDGDYLILDIDIDTGQITNWEKPTLDQIEGFVNA